MTLSEQQPRITYEKKGRIAYVTLNRPEVLNAMDLRMHEELRDVWDDIERDDTIWVGVVSGAGERAFSVGQDLKELTARDLGGAQASSFGSRGSPGWPRLTERFAFPKPLIAKVRGYAMGGGFELALACDVIVAATDASFALPEARLGLIAGAGGVFRLTRQIPFRIAMGHLMTGRSLDARRAYELGLVNEVVPAADLDRAVEQWIEDILGCAPLSVRAVKEAATRSSSMTLEEAFHARYEWEERRRGSEDCKEGPRSFVEKRRPRWQAK